MSSIFEPRPRLTPKLTLSEIGIATGGALIVYLSEGDRLPDGRKKYDPSHHDSDVLLRDMEGIWDISPHRAEWIANPHDGPQVLVAVYGPNPSDRRIVAAARIDTANWSDEANQDPKTKRWNIPLVTPVDLDAHGLQDRRVEPIRFDQAPSRWHYLIDASGTQRHPLDA